MLTTLKLFTKWSRINPRFCLIINQKAQTITSKYAFLARRMSERNQPGKSAEEESKEKKTKPSTASGKPRPLLSSKVVVPQNFNTSSQARKHITKQYETVNHTQANTETTSSLDAEARGSSRKHRGKRFEKSDQTSAKVEENQATYLSERVSKAKAGGNQNKESVNQLQYGQSGHTSTKAEAEPTPGPAGRKLNANPGGSWRKERTKQHEKSNQRSAKPYTKLASNLTETVSISANPGDSHRQKSAKPDKNSDQRSAKVELELASKESLPNSSPVKSEKEPSFNSASKTKKRQRCSSSTSAKQTQEQQESPQPASYRDTKKWRKLQRGPLEVASSMRRWDQVQPVPCDTSGMQLSVMSYNILSQRLLEMHPDLYTQCRTQDLVWPQRGAAILQEIISHNADIICLQEVEAIHWEYDIRPLLNYHGYYGLYKKRVGNKTDGCAILYKKAKFSLAKFVPVMFLQGGVLDRDNVGIIALLRPYAKHYKGDVKTICVATTHLLFNPRRGDVKLAQLMMFLAEIDQEAALEDDSGQETFNKQSPWDHQRGSPPHQLGENTQTCSTNTDSGSTASSPKVDNSAAETSSRRQRYCPIILCGDFNSEPLCDLYRFVTTGQLKYEGLVSRFVCGQREGIESGANVWLGPHLLPSHLGITETCQYLNVLRRRHNRSVRRSHDLFDTWNPTSRLETGQTGGGGGGGCPSEDASQFLQDGHSSNVSGRVAEGKDFVQENHSVNEASCISREDLKETEDKSGEGKAAERCFKAPKTNTGRAYHSMNFQSVYSHFTEIKGPDGRKLLEVSSQHDKCSATVDYIFYTSPPSVMGGSSKNQLELLARYSLLTDRETASSGHLPNATFPSDHLSLIARFFLR